MAGNCQTNVGGSCHGEGLRSSLLRPSHTIRRAVTCEGISTTHELDPVRRVQAGRVVVGAVAAGAGTVLPGHTVARSHCDKRVGSVGVETLANHDSSFRPDINVLHRSHAGDDGAISRRGYISKTERIGRIPDVRSGTGHSEYSIVVNG